MKQLTCSIFFLLLLSAWRLQGQVVDPTRLEYDEDALQARQLGMTVSPDKKLAAFLLSSGELSVLDLLHTTFVKTFKIEIGDVKEIVFTQDQQSVLVVEESSFRLVNLESGDVTLTQTTKDFIKTTDMGIVSNHFAIVSGKEVFIWDASTKSLTTTIALDKKISIVSFSPFEKKILITPTIGAFKKRYSLEYLYETGTQLQKYEGIYLGDYDHLQKGQVIGWKNRPVQSAISVPVLRHAPPGNPDAGTELFILGVVDGKSNEQRDDVGFYLTFLRVKDKVLGTVAFRGFSVFDVHGSGKVFTTKVSLNDRNRNLSPKTYLAHPHYALNDDKVLINAYGDNINQIYSASQNAIIGYIFVDAGGSLAVVTRDGRFDGTADASEKLYWAARRSLTRTKLESTFNQQFSPGLLAELMTGEAAIPEVDLEAQIASVPTLRIKSFNGAAISGSQEIPKVKSATRASSITLEVTENIENASQLKLFHNNKLVGSTEPVNGTAEFDVNLTTTFGEENYFYAVAATADGMESEKKKLVVRYQGKSDDPPKLYLLTVGIDSYLNPKYNLNYATADADAFAQTMEQGASGVFSEVETITIRNGDFTRESVMEALETIGQSAHEQDLFVFYYAGHGVMSEGGTRPSDFFLVPHNITHLYGKDEELFEQALSANELKNIAQTINAQKQVYILDACQSAAALGAVAARGAAEERAIARLARSTGTFWLMAAGSEQFATEFESLGHGVFTYALLEGLAGAADGANADQQITIKELSAWVESRVPELSQTHKGKPQFPSGYSYGNDFPLVVYDK
ncbi:MAG: caspase family protein [Imperialibacter sp.]|uniref:caspase family protein n=1 Tax=Imperialibacter sp. TaxID=2038411 RepID=UPI0032EAA827